MSLSLLRVFVWRTTAFRRRCRGRPFRWTFLRVWLDDAIWWSGVSSQKNTDSTSPCHCSSCQYFRCVLLKTILKKNFLKILFPINDREWCSSVLSTNLYNLYELRTLVKMKVEVSSLVDSDRADWTVDRRVQIFQDLFVKLFVVQIVFLKKKDDYLKRKFS